MNLRNSKRFKVAPGRHRKGFTLIEMMVAIAVVAIAAIAVFQSNSNALRVQGLVGASHDGTLDPHGSNSQASSRRRSWTIQMHKKLRDSRVYQAGQEYEVNIDTTTIDSGYVEMLEFSVYLVVDGNPQDRPLKSAFTFPAYIETINESSRLHIDGNPSCVWESLQSSE